MAVNYLDLKFTPYLILFDTKEIELEIELVPSLTSLQESISEFQQDQQRDDLSSLINNFLSFIMIF